MMKVVKLYITIPRGRELPSGLSQLTIPVPVSGAKLISDY